MLSSIVCASSFNAEATKERLARELYLLSGYSAVVHQIDVWVQSELSILKETNESLSLEQFAKVRQRLEAVFNAEHVRSRLVEQLRIHLSLNDMESLLSSLDRPSIKKSMGIDILLSQSSDEQEAFEHYKARLQRHPALESRWRVIRALSFAQGGQSLEVLVRVELRKSLLRALKYIKHGELIAEARLNKIVEGYRQALQMEGDAERLLRNLYLFRYVPNHYLEAYVDTLQKAPYQSWLGQSQSYLNAYFAQGRSLARLQ